MGLDELDKVLWPGRGNKGKRKPIPKSIQNEVLVRQGYGCYNCGHMLPAVKHFHHKIPISKGGKNNIDNIIALCPNCHYAKHHGESLEEAERNQGQNHKEDYNPLKGIDENMKRIRL